MNPVFLRFLEMAVIALLYWGGAALAMQFAFLPGQVVPIWPPAGVVFAAVILFGYRALPGIAVGILLNHLTIDKVPALFLVYSVGSNIIAAVLSLHFLQRMWPGDINSIRIANTFAYFIGCALYCASSATIGVFGMCHAGLQEWAMYSISWSQWMLGDFFGILICTIAFINIVVFVKGQDKAPWPQPRWEERFVWMLSFGFVALIFAGLSDQSTNYALSLSFMPLVLLIWSALRFKPIYTNIAVMIVGLTIATLAGLGLGGFPQPKSEMEIVTLLLFLSTLCALPQLIAISTYESRFYSHQLVYRANHDWLTKLPNRNAFEDRVTEIIANFSKTKKLTALCYLDLDQFKVVNDTCGHLVGDHLIKQVSTVLAESLAPGDFLARLGGDEFVVIVSHRKQKVLEKRAEELRRVVEAYRFIWDKRIFDLTVSIGMVPINANSDFNRLLSHGDTACCGAKEMGRNRVKVLHHDDEFLSQHHHDLEWAVRITEALEKDRFRLYCQEIFPIKKRNGKKSHFEVLLRLQDKDDNLLLPGLFIPAAERYHLMTRVDRWVVNHILEWLENHRDITREISVCSINLSGPSLGDKDFLKFIVSSLKKSKVPGHKICFEVTETAAIGDLMHATHFIKTLKKAGCLFALDDFGSGLSSFGYLKTLQVDFLKIDGSFVRDINEVPVDLAMVKSINEVGQTLGKKTIAEYVETDDINQTLKQLGVDFGQGYAIGKPMPIDMFFTQDNSAMVSQIQPEASGQ